MTRPARTLPCIAPAAPGRRDALVRIARGLSLAGVALGPPMLGAGLAGCSRGSDTQGEWYSNWDLDGGCASATPGRVWRNALDEDTGVCPGEDPASGRTAAAPEGWTWVFYGAPWCSTSRWQAARMREFVARVGARAEVYAVLTGRDEPFTTPRAADARAWSGTTGLAPRRVLFDPAEDGVRTIPQHLLIGPDGRSWYRYVGGLQVDEMVSLLDDFIDGRRQPRVRRID